MRVGFEGPMVGVWNFSYFRVLSLDTPVYFLSVSCNGNRFFFRILLVRRYHKARGFAIRNNSLLWNDLNSKHDP